MADEPTKPTAPEPAAKKPANTSARDQKSASTASKSAARKPVVRKPATVKTAAKAQPVTKPVKPVKKRASPGPRKPAKSASASKSGGSKTSMGIKIATGIGAIGAVATAALLTLRGSTPKKAPPKPKPTHANQADGTDSSASFAAGIADEGSVPKV